MPPKREKLGFVPAGKAEFLKGAGDPARGGLGGFVPNQQTGKPRSAPEICSDWEEIKNFPFSCMKTPPNPNTAQPSEATTFYPMEYPNSIVEYPNSFVEYPNSTVEYPNSFVEYPSSFVEYPSSSVPFFPPTNPKGNKILLVSFAGQFLLIFIWARFEPSCPQQPMAFAACHAMFQVINWRLIN